MEDFMRLWELDVREQVPVDQAEGSWVWDWQVGRNLARGLGSTRRRLLHKRLE